MVALESSIVSPCLFTRSSERLSSLCLAPLERVQRKRTHSTPALTRARADYAFERCSSGRSQAKASAQSVDLVSY